jgi:hypothetical protein
MMDALISARTVGLTASRFASSASQGCFVGGNLREFSTAAPAQASNHAEVQDPPGAAIPGLFAAGGVFRRIAGKTAAEYVKA